MHVDAAYAERDPFSLPGTQSSLAWRSRGGQCGGIFGLPAPPPSCFAGAFAGMVNCEWRMWKQDPAPGHPSLLPPTQPSGTVAPSCPLLDPMFPNVVTHSCDEDANNKRLMSSCILMTGDSIYRPHQAPGPCRASDCTNVKEEDGP